VTSVKPPRRSPNLGPYEERFVRSIKGVLSGSPDLVSEASLKKPFKTAIHRQAIGDRDRLVGNSDGPLDLYLRAAFPVQGGNRIGCRFQAPFPLLMRTLFGRSDK
jgi:hypothetical protein